MKSKHILLTLLGLFIFVFCSAQVRVSLTGSMKTVEYSVSDFSSLEVSSGMNIEITMGGSEKLSIEAKSDLHEYIEVEVKKNALVIKLKKGYSYNNTGKINVYLSAKKIDALMGSGGTKFTFTNGLVTDKLSVLLSGGGQIKGSITCDKLSAVLSGGSRMDATGKADNFSLVGSGGSVVRGYDFVVNKLDVVLSGGGNAELTVNDKISATASGGSQIRYKGNASVSSVSSSGGSKVVKQ